MSTCRIHDEINKSNDEASENLLPSVLTSHEPFEKTITFCEALEKAKYGKFNYIVIIFTGLAWTSIFSELSAVAFYMPVADCDLQLTNQRKGLLSASGFVGMMVSYHLWGFLGDTKGRRRVILPTVMAGFVTTVISSIATNFWIMFVLRFINGICICGASATIYAYIGEFHTDRTRSKAIMIAAFIFSVGSTFMRFIALDVINSGWRLTISFLGIVYKPWRLFVVVCGIPGLVCGIIMCFLPESPHFLLSIQKEEETKAVLQRIYRINGGKDKLEIPHLISEEDSTTIIVDETEKSNSISKFFALMWKQTVPLFHKKYLRITAIICITQFWLLFTSNGLYMWFPEIINAMGEFMKQNPGENQYLCAIIEDKHKILDTNSTITDCPDKLETTTYIYSLALEISFALSFAIITLIVNRINKIAIMFIIIMFCSSCGLVAVWLPYISISAILYVIFFLTGICINVLGAATVDLYPTQLRAMAIAASLLMGRIGGVVGTNTLGAILANQCEMIFYINCFALMACAVLLLFLPRSVVTSAKSSEAVRDNS